MVKKIFLGGTCGANRWREQIVMPVLIASGISQDRLFNPWVDHWTPEDQQREEAAKDDQDYLLAFVIASPAPGSETENVSLYSVVEAVTALYEAPERTVVCFDVTGMPEKAAKRTLKTAKYLAEKHPQHVVVGYAALIKWLSQAAQSPYQYGSASQ